MPGQDGMLCPLCKVELVMTERQNIEIDYCPKCRGVWLDRGELDKIIERSLAEAGPARATQTPAGAQAGDRDLGHGPSHGPSPGPGPGQPYKKRKSWLSEIFD